MRAREFLQLYSRGEGDSNEIFGDTSYIKSDKFPLIKRTCTQELKALFGLLYIRGMFKQNYWDFHCLWDKEVGHPIFSATMSKARFAFLMRHLCFDDPEPRRERWKSG